MRWFPGCSQFSPIWEKDVCNLGFSVYISDCLWLWLGWMAVYFIRQAVGAYCIRPSNVLLETILHYAKTCLRCLRQHMWGVCNTPLPHTDKEGFPNEKRGVFASLIFFSCLDARSFWLQDLLFLPWCKKRSKRRSRHQGCRPNFRHPTYMNVPGQTSSPSKEGLSFFCFFSFLKERKEGRIRESSKAS